MTKDQQHPYCYPGTDVYRNKLDIRDPDILERYERLVTAVQIESMPKDFPVSPEGYRQIHHHLLSEVYDWAGAYRYVDTGRGAPFCKADYIDAEMNKRFAAINGENNLRGLTADQFADRAAEHVNELNAIHPFLDGNGRTQRAFLEILAERAGHDIDLARIDPEAWNQASIRGFYKQENGPIPTCCAVLGSTDRSESRPGCRSPGRCCRARTSRHRPGWRSGPSRHLLSACYHR